MAAPLYAANADRIKSFLLVEDERQLAETIGDRLRSEGFAVDFAFDANSALEKVHGAFFDLIVLDIMLPQGNGLDLCARIRKSGITTPVLFLTARGQSFEKVAGFKAGGDDYLTKPFESAELVARIHALLRRSAAPARGPMPEGQCQFGPIVLDVWRKKVTLRGTNVPLTLREFQLLRYLAERTGKTVSREELLQQVWGNISGNITRTVDMHIAGLRQKLEANPKRPELILTEPGAGYRFQP